MSSDNALVTVDNLSKSFKLPHEKSASIKSSFVNILRRRKGYEIQRALQDVTFEVNKGDFFGIVGRNGSGKSTLLKLLAGIYMPTAGRIRVNGKLTPFIELGVGFNPELSGRENVFLNGALLGFTRKEVSAMYDDIVDFAEIKRFMDQKLKNYSSGMQVRLAFSIAIKAQSDILLLDEVLAVGDEAFQKKCMAVFEKYKANKQTVILVTHDMSVVEKYCNKAVLLEKGQVIAAGNPRKIAHQYSMMNKDAYLSAKQKEAEKLARLTRLNDWQVTYEITNRQGRKTTSFHHNDTMTIHVKWQEASIKNVGIALLKQSGEYVFGANTIRDKHTISNKQVTYNIDLNLGEGDYEIKLGFFGKKETEPLEFLDDGPSIYVYPPEKRSWEGTTLLKHNWR